MSYPPAMMASCPRPQCLSPLGCAPISGLRCCSRSWRSWPGSATRSTAASWRSWPNSTTTSCGVPRAHGRSRRWWPGRPAPHRITPERSPPSRVGSRSFPAARRACGRADCHWIRSASSRRGRPTDPMGTTRSWQHARLSASCAPPSSSNRGPNPVLSPNPVRGRKRRGRSPRSSTTSPPPGGSHSRTGRRRSSMPRCSLISTQWSPSGRVTAPLAAAYPSTRPIAGHRRRFHAPRRGRLG